MIPGNLPGIFFNLLLGLVLCVASSRTNVRDLLIECGESTDGYENEGESLGAGKNNRSLRRLHPLKLRNMGAEVFSEKVIFSAPR
jgi:hypothetical protein